MIKKSRKTKQSKKIVKQSINSNKKNKIGNKQQKLPKRTRKSSYEQSTEQQETNITVEQKKSQEDRHYCTNPALLQELAIWKETANTCCHCGAKNRRTNDRKTIWKCPKCGKENDKMQNGVQTDKLGLMFMAIARKLLNRSEFRNYSEKDKEDCFSYACEKCVTGIKNYNFKYTNAFAYFTQACFNAFKTQLSKYYKHINIRRAMTKKAIVDLEAVSPNSSMKKCLGNQFNGNDFDNFSEY